MVKTFKTKTNKMIKYKGTFTESYGLTSQFSYTDTVICPFLWLAKIILKHNNSAKMVKIEKV